MNEQRKTWKIISATEFPIPQLQLDLIGEGTYPFGGKDYAGELGIYNRH
ncbi:hypothetical protein Barb6XT_02568 [Bacteroidales bacterium Barb6XT]|nr:hypothetical protein Barb6XT_02568 [Bacteroidales bacterium Barb6XT]